MPVKSQDSQNSRRTSNSSDNGEAKNAIRSCIRKYFDQESFVKFQQVLDFLGQELYEPLYIGYNHNLIEHLTEAQTYTFPEGYVINTHINLKLKFYSFRFISNVGQFILERREVDEEKADAHLVMLAKILLFHALTSKRDTANLALVELEQLCLKTNLTLSQLFQKHKPKFLRLIIKAILTKLNDLARESLDSDGSGNNNCNGSGWSPKTNQMIVYMTRALEVFNVGAMTRDDVSQSLIIITNFIHKEIYNNAIETFLTQLAKSQQVSICTLIQTHIQAIVVSLLIRKKLSNFDMTASLNKISSLCGKSLEELLATKYTFIKGRLLLHYSINPKTVKDGIYFLSKFEKEEPDQPFEDAFDEDSEFIDYLSPSMIGILLGIDSHFNAYKHEMGSADSLKHLESLVKLITLLNKEQVQVIHVKLLSTLSLLLRLRPRRDNQELNKVLRDMWAVFISKLKEEAKVTLLMNLCVAMHDLVEDCPDEIASVYDDLLLKGSSDPRVRDQLKTLFFLPNIPSFKKVYDHLTPYVHREDCVDNLQDLQTALDCVLPLMKIENNKCRTIALTKIKQLLKSNQNLLIANMLNNPDEPLDPLTSRTIQSLLALSSTQHHECLTLIAECLGILGAVNPIRLDHLIYGDISTDNRAISHDIRTAAFIVDLIERLKLSLLSDERNESESANYALQVMVKTFEIPHHPTIAKLLSQEALRACELCKNTHYGGIKKIDADFSTPVYEKFKHEYQYSYKDWLDKFYLNLISLCREDKLRDSLHACTYVFKYNQKLAEFLLPSTIIHIILNQNIDYTLIKREITAIIEEDVGVSTQDLDTVYNQDVKGNVQTLHFQCANMIFCVMDAISRVEADFRAPNQTPSAERRKHADNLRRFKQEIPLDKLAILACKCRSYARALCYYEQYLYTNKQDLDKYATSLQRIYMALDDPYEAAGVEMVRTTPTTLTDDIANYEACGRFDKAFVCYSTSLDDLSQRADKESFLEDSLKCLSNQGDIHRLYEKSRQLVAEYPQFKRSILPAAVEACWKLGKWEKLETLFREEKLDSMLESTSVSQGYLLNSLIENRGDVPERLKIVRRHLIKPLSIAMMDRSAYFRGYQNLLVLHGIEDFALSLEALDANEFATQTIDENSVDVLRPKLVNELKSLFSLWGKRNKLVQPSLRSLEPPMAWQKTISLVLAKKYPFLKPNIDIELGKMCLISADIARNSRNFDRSFLCLTQAQKFFGSEFHKLPTDLQVRFYMGQAKLEWDQGEKTRAIRGLKLSLERLKKHPLSVHLMRRKDFSHKMNQDPFPRLNDPATCQDCSSFSPIERQSFAQLKMLLTQFSEEAADGIPETLFYMYEECVHLGVNQEETYFRLARYYDRLLTYYMENPNLCGDRLEKEALEDSTQRFSQNLMSGDREDVYTKLMEHSVIAFGNSLKFGATYLSESMPRMLNIFFDLGAKKSKTSGGVSRSISSRIETTVRFMDELKRALPKYYFMAAISLMLSRVCHPHSGVTKKTYEILELLLTTYPHQMSWSLIALLNDRDNEERKRAAKFILASVRKKGAEVEQIVKDTIDFSKILSEIATAHGPNDRQRPESKKKNLRQGATLKDLSSQALKFNFSRARVIPPVQSTLRAIFPTGGVSGDKLSKHVVFPESNRFFIKNIQPQVKIFNSLQQPRMIVVECDDGKKIQLICKAGDDLRKDSRCIEFFNLLNRILRRNSQSNARFFEIPTFQVTPLEATIGIIEMMPNCETFRSIIEHLYKERIPKFVLHDYFPRPSKDSITPQELHRLYLTKIPLLSPPVLPLYFLRRFTEPTAWYIARLAFTRSTAVISMGGYIIGLGDRHLDNILLDTSTGRVAHVDFNLLFHQGEALPTPEIVPFRASHNFVAAFGPMGTEGNFRKVCEITMRVMRDEKDALLTTLKPFMHDPCSDWIKVRDTGSRAMRSNEDDRGAENRGAKARIEVVERKLKGFPRSKKFKPLTLYDSYSVEAQVDNLIAEATDTYNLAQMYYGWCPQV